MTSDEDQFEAMDELSQYAVEHAAELAALDRAQRPVDADMDIGGDTT